MRKFILVFLVLPLACTLEQRGAPAPDATTEVVVGNTKHADSVEVIISMPTFAALGDEVPINLIVRNATNRRLELHLNGRQTNFDIAIMRPDSTLVWQRLGNSIQQILQLRPLQPGESFVLEERWRADVPGDYLVTAEIPTDTVPLRAGTARLIVR